MNVNPRAGFFGTWARLCRQFIALLNPSLPNASA